MTGERAPSWAAARVRAHELGQTHARPPVDVPLAQACGATLADALRARTDLPAFPTSSIDGWATRGAGPWRVAGRVLAGSRPAPLADDGTCVEIATGAEVPEGTEQIVRLEEATRTGDGRISGTARPAPEWRQPGEEARQDEELLPTGTPVTPAVLGLAAAAGHDILRVRRRARAQVLVFGDELLTMGLPGHGRVRDALGPSLPAWLARLGAEVGSNNGESGAAGGASSAAGPDVAGGASGVAGPVADTLDAHVGAIRTALTSGYDLICTTGGTMRGPVDHLHQALDALDATLIIDTVAVRPGFPMLLAEIPRPDGGTALLAGLPGNPQSAVVALLSLVAPALAGMSGRGLPPLSSIRLAASAAGRGAYTHLVLVDSGGVPVGHAGSAMLRGLSTAAGFAIIEPGMRGTPGVRVPLLPLPLLPGEVAC